MQNLTETPLVLWRARTADLTVPPAVFNHLLQLPSGATHLNLTVRGISAPEPECFAGKPRHSSCAGTQARAASTCKPMACTLPKL